MDPEEVAQLSRTDEEELAELLFRYVESIKCRPILGTSSFELRDVNPDAFIFTVSALPAVLTIYMAGVLFLSADLLGLIFLSAYLLSCLIAFLRIPVPRGYTPFTVRKEIEGSGYCYKMSYVPLFSRSYFPRIAWQVFKLFNRPPKENFEEHRLKKVIKNPELRSLGRKDASLDTEEWFYDEASLVQEQEVQRESD